jgi:general secretion pathway protein N
MTARHTIVHGALVLLAGLGALVMPAETGAQTSPRLRQAAVDTTAPPRDLSAPAADPVNGGSLPAGTEELPGSIRMQVPVAREREPRGNPLWGIPLRSLTATRERPLFTPTRRPPAPAVAGPPPVEAPAAAPAAGPDRPQLTLVGAISGETDGIAIFLDQITRDIVRLRTGESHSGWTLRSVKGREAALVKDQETVILALPAPTDDSNPAPQQKPNVEL